MLPTLLQLAINLAALAAIGWLTGRLLGLRLGFVRATVAVFCGLLIGILYLGVIVGKPDSEDINISSGAVSGGFVFAILIGTMITAVLIEAVLRGGPGGRRRWRPIRAIRRRLAISGRLFEIARVARRNGIGTRRLSTPSRLFGAPGGAAVRATLEQCGGVMVKFGQIASTREDLLPPAFCRELSALRSSAPALAPDVVRTEVERELGRSIESAFSSFDDKALAAASMGVTHRAIRLDGRDVVVKVLRPGIEETVMRDAAVLRAGAASLERRFTVARDLGLQALVNELLGSVVEELNCGTEALNNTAFAASSAVNARVKVAHVHPDLSTSKMLVMDRVIGVPLDESSIAAAPRARGDLADDLFGSFLAGLLTDGIFHADPHPGNVMIAADGTLYWIDYGAIGILDAVTREGLQQLGLGFSMEDPSLIARALRRIAGPSGERFDMGAVEFEVSGVLAASRGGGLSPEVLGGVLNILRRHHVPVPPALTELSRAFVTLEGTLSLVDPTFAMAPRAKALLTIPGTTPGGLREQATAETLRALPSLRPMPQLLEDIALQTRGGRLTVRTERFGDDRVVIDRWVDRVVLSAMGMVGLLTSALVLMAAGLPGNGTSSDGLRVAGFVGIAVSVGILLRVSAQLLRRSPPDDSYRPSVLD